MNCNPFTLGHQYLVEYAAAKVARLYIFVVEEDRSEFPFADRIELVRQGVKNFPNVEVLPSGKFIISQQTFSGYFNKAELQDVQVDSSEDVEIFGREIAPTLGITIRFAGEEPKDNVTRQYNETMKRILPRYGVEFQEIPRKSFDGEFISASSVREALKRGDFDKIKKFVPESTFNYLREQFSKFQKYISDEPINANSILAALKAGDFYRIKGFVPDSTFKYLLEQLSKFKNNFTARIDIKFMSTAGDFQILSLSDDEAKVEKPNWFQKGGIGYQIQSYVGKLEFIAKAEADGKINLWLRGVSVAPSNDPSKRIPFWIDYTKLIINGEIIFDKIVPVWLQEPYSYKMDVKAGEEITICAEWLPHKGNA